MKFKLYCNLYALERLLFNKYDCGKFQDILLIFFVDLVNQMGVTYSLPLKVAYSASRGFHIQLYSAPTDGYTAENLPGVFIKVTKFKNTFSFTTTDVVSLAQTVTKDWTINFQYKYEILYFLQPANTSVFFCLKNARMIFSHANKPFAFGISNNKCCPLLV